jgi:hypothetical protein
MIERYNSQLPVTAGRAKRFLLEKVIQVMVIKIMPVMTGTHPIVCRKLVRGTGAPKALALKARVAS